ncbi:MAG: M20/M25/M40 family metallo-hydrolase [Verrucomicrobiae bacterium]|nr:M20/M25/M40 family metallo-hydrolase [Verrucomicrobiae bacterium]
MDNELREWRGRIERRLPGMLELLRSWVGVNSHTSNRAGVARLGRLTAEAFRPLGFEADFVPHADPALGDHLVLTRRGRSDRTVALVSHLDTVFEEDEEERNGFRWQVEGDRAYGPGTIDIKGGSAMMHLVLSALAEGDPEAFEAVTWVAMWDASEETLSEHFAEVSQARLDPDRTCAALVFEAEGRPNGRPSLVVARKGRATVRMTVEGRGAHAGVRHADGANAITQLGRLVDRIAGLTDYGRELTVNVGRVEGGGAVNRVPHWAEAEVELRAFRPDVLRAGIEALRRMAGEGDVASVSDGHRCRVRMEVLTENPPWPRNDGTEGLFTIWNSVAMGLGAGLDRQERGGLSDGNWLCGRVPTLDGLGPYGEHDHCSERSADGSKVPEYLHLPSVAPKALLNVLALRRLIRG